MTNEADFRVIVASPPLPPPGTNMTGSPALVRKLLKELCAQGVDARILELSMAMKARASRFSEARCSPLLSIQIVRLLQSVKPAVLHCHGHTTAGVLLPYAWFCGIPLVCEIHGIYHGSKFGVAGNRPVLSRIAEELEIPVLRHVDHVIVQAEMMRERLIAAGIPEDTITKLYPGLRVGEIRDYSGDVPAELASSPGSGIRVVYVGSHHPYQGLDLLQKAQQVLRHLSPGRFQFMLVMSSSDDEMNVKDQYGFDESTTIVSLKDSTFVPAWLKAADVLVHSRPDIPDNVNVQSKLGLYLAAGRPIVATNVGDYRQLLGGLGGCVLANPDAESVARAIQSATDPAIRRAAVSNPDAAEIYFDISKNTDALLGIYCKLLTKRRKQAA